MGQPNSMSCGLSLEACELWTRRFAVVSGYRPDDRATASLATSARIPLIKNSIEGGLHLELLAIVACCSWRWSSTATAPTVGRAHLGTEKSAPDPGSCRRGETRHPGTVHSTLYSTPPPFPVLLDKHYSTPLSHPFASWVFGRDEPMGV